MIDIDALEKEAADAEAAAKASELTEAEQRAVKALGRRNKAREDKVLAEKARRDLDRAAREAKAAAAAGKQYLVKGIDLIADCFTDVAPPAEQLPGNGVIVIRSPDRGRFNAANNDIEHKRRPMAEILIDLLVEHVIDPDVDEPGAGAHLRAFCEAYPGAGMMAGDEVYKLGGMKAKADKRGRG